MPTLRRPRLALSNASIAGRLVLLSLVWLAGLAVVSGVAWYGQSQVGRAQAVAEKAADLSTFVGQTRSKAAALNAAERSFLNTPTTQSAAAIDVLLAATVATVADLNTTAKSVGLPGDGPVLLRAATEEVRASIGRLKQVQKRMGFGAEDGIAGTLAAAQAELRTAINKVSKSGQNPATIRIVQAFAQMGQAKAEYMLAADDVSKGSFDAAAGRFDRQVGTAEIDDKVKSDLKALSKTFFDAFAAYGEVRAQRERAVDKVSLAFDNLEPPAAAVEAAAAERRQAALGALEASSTTVLLALAATVAVTIGLGLAASVVLGRGITGPLAGLGSAMQALSRGEDVEVSGTGRGDEIGRMARAVAVFRENGRARERLEAESERAMAAERDRQNRTEAAVRNFRTEIGALLATVAETADRMRGTAMALTGSAEESAGKAQHAASASDAASDKVTVVAAAAEELAASIAEIASQVARTTAIIADANRAARDSNAKVSSLAGAAARVGEVVTLIQTIAEQTNLLALNATIEAARAGEAGRGFAVVASEVKNLATQTGKATEQIARQIADIQDSTREAVAAIDAIATIMEEVNQTTGAIAAAVEEQGAATSDISRTVQDASADTQVVSVNVAGVTSAISETRNSATLVEAAAADVARRQADLERTIDGFLTDVAA